MLALERNAHAAGFKSKSDYLRCLWLGKIDLSGKVLGELPIVPSVEILLQRYLRDPASLTPAEQLRVAAHFEELKRRSASATKQDRIRRRKYG